MRFPSNYCWDDIDPVFYFYLPDPYHLLTLPINLSKILGKEGEGRGNLSLSPETAKKNVNELSEQQKSH